MARVEETTKGSAHTVASTPPNLKKDNSLTQRTQKELKATEKTFCGSLCGSVSLCEARRSYFSIGRRTELPHSVHEPS